MNTKRSSFFKMNVCLAGLLTGLGFLGCAVTVFGFLGRFAWFLDLFSHFRVQYLFGLSVLGLSLLMLGRRKAALILMIFAGINLGIILPLYFGGQSPASESAYSLRAMLLNVNTCLGDAKRVKYVIQEYDPDIIVLEEINSQWVSDLQWLTESHPHSCVQSRDDNFGIGLFSKLPLVRSEVVYIGIANVPSIVATLDTEPGTLDIIATHPLPPGGAGYSQLRNDQLDEIPDYIRLSSPVLLLGAVRRGAGFSLHGRTTILCC